MSGTAKAAARRSLPSAVLGRLANSFTWRLHASRLSAFDSRGGSSNVWNPEGFPDFFAYTFTGFVITSLEPAATVPEPGTGLLAAAALALQGSGRRRSPGRRTAACAARVASPP